MPRKPKFRPEIRRVKLNPEQAVLSCDCYGGGLREGVWVEHSTSVCVGRTAGAGCTPTPSASFS